MIKAKRFLKHLALISVIVIPNVVELLFPEFTDWKTLFQIAAICYFASEFDRKK